MQDQTRNHDVKVVVWELERFGSANLEVRIRAARSLASCVLDHRGRWIDSNGEAALSGL